MSATPKNRGLSADSLIPRQEAAAASLPKATVHDADGLEPLWDTATAAEFLGISVPTVQRMRSDGSGPRFVRLGRGKRSRIAYAALIAMINQHKDPGTEATHLEPDAYMSGLS